MSVQLINNANTHPINLVSSSAKTKTSVNSKSRVYDTSKEASNKVKAGAMLMTLAGIATTMGIVFKCKKIPCNSPSKFFKALTSVQYKKKHEVETLVSGLAFGSVGGGLLGGALFDKKEHFKAKCREAVIQLVGNIFTPLACVASGIYAFDMMAAKYPKALNKANVHTKALRVILPAVCLIAGAMLGNKIGNAVDEKVFKVKDDRKIKLADLSPHLDDLCFATSLIAKDIDFVPRLIPLAFIIAGYSTGSIQEKTENLNKKEQLQTNLQQAKCKGGES